MRKRLITISAYRENSINISVEFYLGLAAGITEREKYQFLIENFIIYILSHEKFSLPKKAAATMKRQFMVLKSDQRCGGIQLEKLMFTSSLNSFQPSLRSVLSVSNVVMNTKAQNLLLTTKKIRVSSDVTKIGNGVRITGNWNGSLGTSVQR